MIRLFSLAMALSHFLIAYPAAQAQIFKCNINGSVQYQQTACQSNQATRQPTVEELNAQRKKQLVQEKDRLSTSKAQARPVANPEPLGNVSTQIPV